MKLFIIAAGKQTRFKSDIPKCLYKFRNSNVLEHNLSIVRTSKIFDEIWVFVSDKSHFTEINGVKIVEIESGHGCGEAVFQALNYTDNEDLFIMWGDCILTSPEIFKFKAYSKFNIPVKFRINPYVKIFNDDVQYSKFGEVDGPGFQDLSVFQINSTFIKELLKQTEWRRNELLFLDILKLPGMFATVDEVKDYEVYAFNTIEELKYIEEKFF